MTADLRRRGYDLTAGAVDRAMRLLGLSVRGCAATREFPPEVGKIIYTTNSMESLNYQLQKIIKNRATSRTTTR